MSFEISQVSLIALTCAHITGIRACCQQPQQQQPSVDDETGECFGQRRRVTGRGADEWNTQSQLETKERPAKGPIAQSWLTPQWTSHTYTCVHIVIIFHPFSGFSLFSFTAHSPFLLLLSNCFILFLISSPLFIFTLPVHFMRHIFCLLAHFLHDPTLDLTVTVQWVSIGIRSAFCSGPPLFPCSLGNAPKPSPSSAVCARMMWFPLTAVMKAGCRKSICRVADFRNFSCTQS